MTCMRGHSNYRHLVALTVIAVTIVTVQQSRSRCLAHDELDVGRAGLAFPEQSVATIPTRYTHMTILTVV